MSIDSQQVQQQMQAGTVPKVNMHLPFVKHQHASWMIHAVSKLKASPSISIQGWRQTGILEVLTSHANKEML